MKTKIQLFKLPTIIILTFLIPSCASIVSTSKYPITLHSNPPNADVSIKNQKNQTVFEGKTPTVVELKSGTGYFKAASYLVTFKKEGFETRSFPINSEIDMWYYANFFLGGLIGMLIVDPITGAMYKLVPQYIHAELYKSQVLSTGLYKPVHIYTQNDGIVYIKIDQKIQIEKPTIGQNNNP